MNAIKSEILVPSLVLVTVVFRNEELTVRLAITFLFTKIKNIKKCLILGFYPCTGTRKHILKYKKTSVLALDLDPYIIKQK